MVGWPWWWWKNFCRFCLHHRVTVLAAVDIAASRFWGMRAQSVLRFGTQGLWPLGCHSLVPCNVRDFSFLIHAFCKTESFNLSLQINKYIITKALGNKSNVTSGHIYSFYLLNFSLLTKRKLLTSKFFPCHAFEEFWVGFDHRGISNYVKDIRSIKNNRWMAGTCVQKFRNHFV